MKDGIFVEYKRNFNPVYFADDHSDITYQPSVYELALYLADRSQATSIIDIGCGNGLKLKDAMGKYQIIGVDFGYNANLFKQNLPNAMFYDVDLNTECPVFDQDIINNSIVICSDVIEHLVDLDPILHLLSELSYSAKYLVVSTPDRIRSRGILDYGPPANTAHVREWTIDELSRFFKDKGCLPGIWGYTINTDKHRQKSIILYIGGKEIDFNKEFPQVKACGLISSYNDEDIIGDVIYHHLNEGLQIHVIDNWSQDSTFNIIQQIANKRNDVTYERFPEKPTNYYDWASILDRKLAYSLEHAYDWYLHIDSDEIRESPLNTNLLRTISFANYLGYNAIDFTVIDFRPTDVNDTFSSPDSFNFFEFGRRPGHFIQIKGWKKGDYGKITLSDSGGHEIAFNGRKIYPLKFLLRHYPLRSKQQIDNKIIKGSARREKDRREKGWHYHYDSFLQNPKYTWDKFELIPYKREMFQSEFIIERLTGIGIVKSESLVAIPDDNQYNLQINNEAVANLNAKLNTIYNSWSWRVTKPLRIIGATLNKLFSKGRNII